MPIAPAIFQSYLFVWWFLLGHPARQHRDADGAQPDGRRLGRADPARARGRRDGCCRCRSLLAVPLLFGLHELYAWARPDVLQADRLLRGEDVVPVRRLLPAAQRASTSSSGSCSATCCANGRSRGSPRRRVARARAPARHFGDRPARLRRHRHFAAVDWIMSLMPQWYSTTFGLPRRHRPDDVRVRVRHRLHGVAHARCRRKPGRPSVDCTDLRAPHRRCARTLPGPRQPAADVRDDLGVPRLHPIPDHLGRGPAERDRVVPAARGDRAGTTSRCCSL